MALRKLQGLGDLALVDRGVLQVLFQQELDRVLRDLAERPARRRKRRVGQC
jgi:hypothetical protein